MTVWAMLGIAVLAAVLAVTLRHTQPAFATVLTLLAGTLLLLGVMPSVWSVLERSTALLGRFREAVPFAEILIKALGICLLTQTAADVCRDVGESALAAKAELVGKTMMLLCGMPLFEYAVQMLEQVVRGEAVGL